MKEIIERLKQSPLFNLSLSSKELFHSNFLYWLGSNYPGEFGELFAEYLNKQPSDYTITEIYREKANIDLSFTYNNGQAILIENKVKSMPYLDQLAKYSKKHSNDKNYILLSLSEPIFFKSEDIMEINGAKWFYLNYSALQEMLTSLSQNIDNEYHKQIINDYCTFIGCLIEVNKKCTINEDDFFNFHSKTSDELYEALSEIRLQDFYLKKKYELLAYAVYNRLKKNGKNLIEFSQNLNWESELPIIFVGYGMSRGLGLMDLKYLVSKNLILGIQVQGEHYRMVVEDNNGKIADRIKEKLDDSNLWFDFSNSVPGEKVYPKPEKRFNKYGNVFFYKSVKLGTEFKISELINIIIKDVEHIQFNIGKVQEIIKEECNSGI